MEDTSNKELTEKMARLFGLPDQTISFSVHFHHNKRILVKCDYYPKDATTSLIKVFTEYEVEAKRKTAMGGYYGN
jgi:hypothetical protein